MAQQELSSEEMYGISKRINKELEIFPLHTHSAICEMVKVGLQHRQLAGQIAHQQAKQEQENRILAIREHEMQQQQDKAAIRELGPLPPLQN